jgi:hypothetical protein
MSEDRPWPTIQRYVGERIVEDSLRLLELGYEPIPIYDKAPVQGGWTGRVITPEGIRQTYDGTFWPTCHDPAEREIAVEAAKAGRRGYDYPDPETGVVRKMWAFEKDDGSYGVRRHANGIGVRVRGFAAIDADVNCPDMQTVIADILRKHLGEPWYQGHLLRFGNGVKTMRLSAISSGEQVKPTARLVRPGDDPEAPETATHRIEVFPGVLHPQTGNPIRQIGVYGVCGHDRVYRFEDDFGLLQVPRSELVPMDREALVRALAEIDGGSGRGGRKVVYLPPDLTVFSTRGWLRVDQLLDGDRVRMLEIRGEGTNVTRGSVFADDRWGVGVVDFEDDDVVYRMDVLDAKAAALWDRLEAAGEALGAATTPEERDLLRQLAEKAERALPRLWAELAGHSADEIKAHRRDARLQRGLAPETKQAKAVYDAALYLADVVGEV